MKTGDVILSTKSLRELNHELRTPLAGILGLSHYFERGNLNAQQLKWIECIEQSGKELLKTVEELTEQLLKDSRVGE